MTLYEKKAKGDQVRSRAAWIELGEKCTKYVLGLEKSRRTNNVIHSLKDKSGSEKLEDQDILQVARDFYVWFKYDLGQKYYAPQVRPDRGSNLLPPDHDSTLHVTETPSLTTWPSVTSKKKCSATLS